MSKHFNLSLSQWINRIFNFKGQFPTSEVSDIIQPVVCIEPVQNIVRGTQTTATGTMTIYTTPADKDFFLEVLTISYTKNATCDVATGTLDVALTVDGTARNPLRLSVITLTAERDNVVLSLPHPIKIDRNTSITLSGTFGAGAMARSASIIGYTQETLSSSVS